jgi:WD40 repeat protein
MIRFDRVLIDPSPELLTRTLDQAVSAANQRARRRLLAWPPGDFASFEQSLKGDAEGVWQWTQQERATYSAAQRSIVAVAWWTDWIGRKHVRITAHRTDFNRTERRNVFTRGQERPAQWAVYPERLYMRQDQKDWVLHGVCECGMSGSPRDLGWMGDRCGPCHDRLETGALGQAAGLPSSVLTELDRPAWAVSFSRDGKRLFWQEQWRPEVHAWQLAAGQAGPLPRPEQRSAYSSFPLLEVSTDGRWLLSSDTYRGLVLYDLTGGETPRRLHTTGSTCNDVIFTADSQSLLEMGLANYRDMFSRLYVRSLEPGAVSREVRLPRGDLRFDRMAMSPDGRLLATAAASGEIFLQRFPDGGVVYSWSAHSAAPAPRFAWSSAEPAVRELIFSPDGRWIASSGTDQRVRVWNAADGGEHPGFRNRLTGAHFRIAFAPDGGVLAAGDPEGVLRLCDTTSGKLHGAYRWHPGRIESLAFSPAGHWLATSGSDDSIKLWPWIYMVK